MKRLVSLRAPLIALTLLALGWGLARQLPSAWIDGVWLALLTPPSLALRSALASASPLPLTLVALLAVLALALVAARRAGGGFGRRLLWGLVPLVALGPLFEFSFGLAYRRAPLAQLLDLPSEAASSEELLRFGERLRDLVWDLDPDDPEAVALGAPWNEAAMAAGGRCVAALEQQIAGRSAPLATSSRVRRLPAGTLLSGGFAGITDPWTLEVYVDAGLPPLAALQTALHEFGHALRFAREADTEALALIAGLGCDDPWVRFASASSALTQLQWEGIRRFGADAELRERFVALGTEAPPTLQVAQRASSEAGRLHRRAVAESVTRVGYDLYLRTQGIEAGLADYSRAAAILMAADLRCGDRDGAWCGRWP